MKTYQIYTLSSSSNPEKVRYVGVTSTSTKKRWYQHKYNANHRKSTPVAKWLCKHLSIGDEIIMNVIDTATEKTWEEKEKYWIAKYREKYNDLLNVDDGGRGVITIDKRNTDSVQRSIEAHYKPIVVISLDGKVTQYQCVTDCAKALNVVKSAIGNVLHGTSTSCGNYYIVTKEEYDKPDFDVIDYINQKNLKRHIHPIYQYDLQGKLLNVYWSSCQVPNCTRGLLQKVINNKEIYHKSLWSYQLGIDYKEYHEKKRTAQRFIYIVDNQTFGSLKELSNYFGVSESFLHTCIKNNLPVKGSIINKQCFKI